MGRAGKIREERRKKKKERGEVGWAEKRERVGSLFFFKSFFKPISNLLNSNLFHVFKLKF
jgi:hypothetical protein